MADSSTTPQESKRSPLPLVLAFVAGVALAGLLFFALPKQQGSSAPVSEPTEQAGSAEQGSSTAPAEPAKLDIAATFPSWDPESESLAELTSFVQSVCDPASPNYREPADRIATFDMDGTLLCEKAPIYVDYCLLMYRVLDDPNYKAAPEVVELCKSIREYADRGEKNSANSPGKHIAIAHEFAGMTPEEFRAYVQNFLDTVPAVGFEGMTYGQTFYKPMLEVVDYLRANDFDVWMVSACEREVVRAAVERIGIDPTHVIATDVAFTSTKLGDQRPDEYNMGQDEDVVLGEPLDEIECGQTAKSLAIAREIGKRPVLAFGNSSGDYGMLNYAELSGGMGLLVVADDEVREYGNEEKAKDIYAKVSEESWTSFSMKNDWKTIYGEGVTKTHLPAEEELAEAA